MMKRQMTEVINKPNPTDILCGKDKTYNRYTGNIIFRKVIEEYSTEYVACGKSKHQKMQMTRDIVNLLQTKYNSRFIKPLDETPAAQAAGKSSTTGQWCEISDLLARDKVSHALRFVASRRGLLTSRAQRRKRDKRSSASDQSSTSSSGSIENTSSSNKNPTYRPGNVVSSQEEVNDEEDDKMDEVALLFRAQRKILTDMGSEEDYLGSSSSLHSERSAGDTTDINCKPPARSTTLQMQRDELQRPATISTATVSTSDYADGDLHEFAEEELLLHFARHKKVMTSQQLPAAATTSYEYPDNRNTASV